MDLLDVADDNIRAKPSYILSTNENGELEEVVASTGHCRTIPCTSTNTLIRNNIPYIEDSGVSRVADETVKSKQWCEIRSQADRNITAQQRFSHELILPSNVDGKSFSNGDNIQTLLNRGQLYVIGHPSTIPSTSSAQLNRLAVRSKASVNHLPINGYGSRDNKRRATHNEVERRRRDTINCWIMTLAKLIPDINNGELSLSPNSDSTKPSGRSKGGILAKACEYITCLRKENVKLHEISVQKDQLIEQRDHLRAEMGKLRDENVSLKIQLHRQGIFSDAKLKSDGF